MRRSGFRRRNKYGAVKTKVDGVMFDSRLEAGWYEYLKILLQANQIRDLELQKEFQIYIQERLVCTYIADYFYFSIAKNIWTVGDAKGVETDVFKLKWKMMRICYPDYDYQIFKGKPLR